MRLIYVTASFPFSASEVFFLPEVKEFLRQGHEVLMVPRSPGKRIIHRDAVTLREKTLRAPLLSPAILASALVEISRNPRAFLSVLRLLFRSRTPFTLARNLAVVPKALWLVGVVRTWRAEHVHAHWGLTTATMAHIAAEFSGVPWSYTAHRSDIVADNLLAEKNASAQFVRYISLDGLRMAEDIGVCAPVGKRCIIHMGVEIPLPLVQGAGNKEVVRLLCPAGLVPVKGHRYLLEAMALLKKRGVQVRLRLAGEGELKEDLKRRATGLSVGELVDFLSLVPHEMLLESYRSGEVDIVVLPSVDLGRGEREGIPVSLIEAMSYSIPVVSTSTGGIPELLSGGAGVLIPPAAVLPLADAIQSLVNDPAARSRLGKEGRKRVEEAFAVGNVVARLVDCCQYGASGDSPTGPL